MSLLPISSSTAQSVKRFAPLFCMLPLTPWLAVYLLQTWQMPAFRYIPLLLGLCGLLLWKEFQPSRAPRSRILGIGIAACGILISLLGAFSNSPWLVWVGVVGHMALLAGYWRGIEDDRSAWPIWLLLCLSIRPPGETASRITQMLQGYSSRIASGALDLLYVVHHRAGNVIELPNRRFMVEEACSGVQSLFALVFVAASLCVVYRRSLIQSVGMLCAAATWATVMNVFRILIVILGHRYWQYDWTSGWQHELIGYLALTIAIGLLLSTDRLIYLFTGPILESVNRVSHQGLLNPLIGFYNSVLGGGVGPWFVRVKSDFIGTAEQRRQPLGRPLLGLLFLPSLSLLLLGIPRCWGYWGTPNQSPSIAIVFNEANLPETISSWQRMKFETERRALDDSFGADSAIWIMEQRGLQGRVSVDYCFSGWHDLSICYQSIGWEIVNREIISPRVEADDNSAKEIWRNQPWQAVQVAMRNSEGRHALLLYSLCDLAGNPLESPIDSALSQLRLKALSNFSVVPATFQLQVFVPLTAPPTPQMSDKAVELHRQSREILRTEFVNQLGRQP